MIKEKNYISAEGHNKLQSELNFLTKEERPKVTSLISWAASNGDRSENADYIYGKRRLREIDRRISFLHKRLNCAEIVDYKKYSLKSSQENFIRVKFGASIVLEDEEGEIKNVTILGEDEVDLEKNIISWKSPLGKALLDKSQGDEVFFTSPNGQKNFTILSIEYK